MKNSIHKRDIIDIQLGEEISLFQQNILESYHLDSKVFALKLKDEATAKEYIFDYWSSVDGEETVYEYMKNRNFDMKSLERAYLQHHEKFKIYDARQEGRGI